MASKVDARSVLAYRAAWMTRHGPNIDQSEASIAKLYCSEAAQEVVDQALADIGGMGVIHGTVVERLYRHVRAFSHLRWNQRNPEAGDRETSG